MFFSDTGDMREINCTVFSSPPTAFDPVMGYRWLPGFRIVRVIRGEVVIDHRPRINAQGYVSEADYTPRKPSAETFRIAVLGDSFTNCLYMEHTWPEMLQHLLNSRPESGRRAQVYGFPTDGGGLVNWHSTFMDKIVPEYEFDALVIADWGDDLARKFISFHSTETEVRIGLFEDGEHPRSEAEFQARLPETRKIFDVAGESEIDELVESLKDVEGPRVMVDRTLSAIGHGEVAPQGYTFSPEAFVERYGALRFEMLGEIASCCEARGVPVVFSAVPTLSGLLLAAGRRSLLHRLQSEGIATHFGVGYHDGYSAFQGIKRQRLVDYHWLKYDGHWGMAAANLYAVHMAEQTLTDGLFG